MFGLKKEIEKLHAKCAILEAKNGALANRVSTLEGEKSVLASKLTDATKELISVKGRMETLEKSYGPLFDFFLQESESPSQKGSDYFQPQHTIHPDGDYEEGKKK